MKICSAEEILALRRRGLPLYCGEAFKTTVSDLENQGFAFTFSWTEDANYWTQPCAAVEHS